MTRLIATIIGTILVLVVIGGCNSKSVPEAKKEAYQRWHETRAQILYGMASEHYKVGQLNEAQSKLTEALSLDENHTSGRLLLGKVYIEQGQYALAISELKKIHEEIPESAEVLYLLGVAQEKKGLFDEALVSYRRCQALDETNLSAVTAAAEVLVNRGEIRQAQLYIESYMSKAGNEPGMYELAGRLAIMQKDYDTAARYYQQACDLDHKNLQYTESLTRAQFFAQQHGRALENLKTLAKLDKYKHAAWVFTMIGDCYMAIGQTYNARGAYQRAADINPLDPGGWSNLAKAALSLEDLPHVMLAASQALSLDSGCLDATLLLGYALLRDGQVTRSLSLLTQAIAHHPHSPELQCVLGRAHSVAGNSAEAMRCYATALRMDPKNALARQLLSEGSTPKLSKSD